MEEVLGYLTLRSLWGHMTKFIINGELIWLPWLTLSDFSLGYICLRGENDCTELKGYFPLQIHLGLSLRSYAPWHQNWTHGLWKTANDIMGKKWCQLRFVFPSLSGFWQRGSLSRICKAFRWGKGRISSSSYLFCTYTKIVSRVYFSVFLVSLCYYEAYLFIYLGRDLMSN